MNASEPIDTPSVVTTAPLALWRIAEAFMHILHGLFGNPEDIARQETFTRKPHQLLLSWLRVAEALMRRLLIVEAAAFPIVPPPSRRHAGKKSAVRTRRIVEVHADKPEDWRVSFKCFTTVADRRLPAGSQCLDVHPPELVETPVCRLEAGGPVRRTRFFSAWPLAERYEALLRVFNDPAPFARRLAKRLRALPHRLCELLRAPEDAPQKVGDDEFAALTDAAESAAAALVNSS